MSSAEEIIRAIGDYYKKKPIVPIVDVKASYWCGDGFYEPETHSLYFSLGSKRLEDLKTLELQEQIELKLTSLTISLYYGEDIGDVIFRIPPRKGGSLVIDVFNIAQEYEMRIKEEILEICELMNFKPSPEDLFFGRPKKLFKF